MENQMLINEWNYDKNKSLPNSFSDNSGKKVWWKCKYGHEWEAIISDRNRGNGCPYCAGKRPILGVNDLATTNPLIATEWNYERNGSKVPSDFKSHSGKKVWWKCKNGHEWQATIDSRHRNGCPYCAGQRVILGVNDLETIAPDIAAQWDYEKNDMLLPNGISANSNKKVWWKCRFGHEWYTSPNSRVSQRLGCPKCSEKLKTSFPEQAIYYYMKKCFHIVESRKKLDNKMEIDIFIGDINVGIEYDGIRYHSTKEAHNREIKKNRLCEEKDIRLLHVVEVNEEPKENKENYYYRILEMREHGLNIIINQLLKDLCIDESDVPVVDVRKDQSQIMSQYLTPTEHIYFTKDILDEWDYEKNGSLTPDMVDRGSHRKIWWKCSKGHSFQCSVYHRTSSKPTYCPYCSNQKVLVGYNDFETIHPKLALQWNYKKNDSVPSEYTANSSKKVWWKCTQGHEWEAAIRKRVIGESCPICCGKKVLAGYNDLLTTYPSIAEEWNYELNKDILPINVTGGSNKKVWWKCRYGHIWEQSINQRTRRNGNMCPECRRSNKRNAKSN